jgi:hypothetical protein
MILTLLSTPREISGLQLRPGLLTSGSPNADVFPFASANSDTHGRRCPQLQRRDREGFTPSSLRPECYVRRTVEEEYLSCQVRGKGGEKIPIYRTGWHCARLADRIHPQKMV